MKYLQYRVIGALLVAILLLGVTHSVMAGARHSEQELTNPVAPSAYTEQIPCSGTFHEQQIPDDGSWLQVCLLDPAAPDKGEVSEVNVKYLLDHPNPDQLQVLLTRTDSDISQTLWDRGVPLAGTNLGAAHGLDAFRGTPAQSGWILLVRDVVPGQAGWLRGLTVHASYAPLGPLPEILAGTAGQPTSLRIPPGSVASTTLDMDDKKPDAEEQGSALEQTSGWQDIKHETFEGAFPNTGWSLLDINPNDGKEYLWDDDDYRHHLGSWAAWPANGGANWLDPAISPYPPFTSSWMIYGPFDLSDAATAEVDFWLWRQIEVYYDYIYFAASHDSTNFTAGWYWDGTAGWEEIRISLDNMLGDDSVWVGWYFHSNFANQYEGPWVDDILIRKYLVGDVTAQGTFYYYDRDNNQVRSRFTKVHLYDDDPGGNDDWLATTNTDAYGYFQFPTMTNWDEDDTDPDPNNRRLDLYVVWEADYNDSGIARHRVTNFGNQNYKWYSFTSTNTPDGTINFSSFLPTGFPGLEAMWIFQDLRKAWEEVYDNTSPHFDPGSVTAKWEDGENCYPSWPFCTSFFNGGVGGPFIFVSNLNRISGDTVVHEAGHHYMWNATGWWLWWDVGCYSHQLFGPEDVRCAWSEGWADFLPLPVNGDACYDFGPGPCGAGGGAFENLETHSRNDAPQLFPWGDTVEGRVAGSLYDLFDATNEGYDSAAFGFDPIADIVLQGADEDRFSGFWESWKASGQNKHHAVRAIYQNTIDYNTAPRFDPLLPDRIVLQNTSYPYALDLWAYSSDDESADAELLYLINVTDWRCGISSDGRWVHIAPQPNWLGFCDVIVWVDDSLKIASDIFRVSVVPIVGRVYVPYIRK
ncbi:MAG: hypothetical protein A2W33_10785 [Chloroflexi bacterium RBG_16_52_11]|nr:MAG: hypothetical protein A2W33_10785 [Chloroflexi bacterium RBG_16_52_11]